MIETGPWILTHSGVKFHLMPRTRSLYDDIDIEDIAHALSNIQRFTGHGNRQYSVATHSICVSRLARNAAKRDGLFLSDQKRNGIAGLLHDATEAYLGDVSSPLKSLLPGYKELERELAADIHLRFGKFHALASENIRQNVHFYDRAMLKYEAMTMLHHSAKNHQEFLLLPDMSENDLDIVSRVMKAVEGEGEQEDSVIAKELFLAEFRRNGGIA